MTGELTQGKRVADDTSGRLLNPGEYSKQTRYEVHGNQAFFYARSPNGLLADLSQHHVTEHEDGTVTAAPSILINRGCDPTWHGYLERGVWREA